MSNNQIEISDEYLQSYLGEPCDGVALSLQMLLDELNKWNKAYNLTAIKDKQQQVSAHILDSLAVASFLEGDRILDVGSGAGFPGLPLAILKPQLKFVLLDSNAKKTRFIQHMVMLLKLDNVEVVTARIEQYQPNQLFTTVLCRAFTSLEDFVQKTHTYCVKKGLLLAMKGRYPSEELEKLSDEFEAQAKALEIPGLNAERHMLLIRRA